MLTGVACCTQLKAQQPGLSDTARVAKDTATQVLDNVTITSRYYRNYKLDNTSGSLKVSTALLQLPQNIQEVDKSILADQIALSINESITRNVSGAMRNNTADFYSPLMYMRGAGINTLRNGIDISMIYYGPMPEDAALMDRVEYIKGPAGFVNAIGDPAGSFNIVTKQPGSTTTNQVSLTAGSFDLYRLTGDFNGSFDKNNRWQYRLNLAGQKAQSFQKYAFNDKAIVNPVLKYNINSHSSVTAEYIYQHQRYKQYLMTVFSPYGFGSLPVDFSITDPNKAPVKANEHNTFLTYQNSFNSKWQLTVKGAFARDQLDGNYFFISRYDATKPEEILRRVTYERFNTAVYALQAFVNGQVNSGSIVHKLLGGVDVNYKNMLAYSGQSDPTANQTVYALNVKNPVYGLPFYDNVKTGKLEDIANNKQAIRYYAAYAQDELNLLNNRLRVTVAARLTASRSSVDKPVASASAVSNVVVTPRLGISYSVCNTLSVYVLRDQTFTPQSGISATGDVFKPLKGKNLEAGVKKDWANGRWNTSVSAYAITRDNITVTDPQTNLQSQIGQTRSKGVEFDMKGEVVKGLNVVVNYAYTDSYISKDANKANIGLPSPYRVKHIQNSWLNYRLPLRKIKGFSVSGGYQWQGGRAGRYSADGDLHLANIFRVDGGLGWAGKHFAVNAIVNNIFNRYNYGSAWTRPAGIYAYVPLAPREVRATLSYSF